MSAIFEIIVFVVYTMTLIFNSIDSVYLGDYTFLDICLSLMYLEITLWGLFSLIRTGNESVDETVEEREKTWW